MDNVCISQIKKEDSACPGLEKKNIWQSFKKTADVFPDDLCLLAGDKSYTYRQIAEESLKLARGLWHVGIGPGSHVAVQLENGHAYILVTLALARLCAVKVAVNTLLGQCEARFVINQSDSVYLITDGCRYDSYDCDSLKMIIVTDDDMTMKDRETVPVVCWRMLMGIGEADDQLPEFDGPGSENLVSDIIYTSGSTSAPKGVLLTHQGLLKSAWANCVNRKFERGRRVYIPLPLFHVYGYVEGVLSCFLTGGTILIRAEKFRAERAIDFMAEKKAQDILSVPFQMIAIINYLKENPRELPDLQSVYCSASVCPDWVWPGIKKYLGVSDVITGYGMTELCGAIMQSQPCSSDENLMTKVGRLLYHDEDAMCRIVDGELWCRGSVVTKGYYHRPEANKKAFSEDGWFKTGDCGYFDEDGNFVITGRMDDMYKINGENVSPKMIEEILIKCSVIEQVQIVGIPDHRHGYIGCCFCQLVEDTEENRACVEAFAGRYLANFQRPKYYFYVHEHEWPKTSTGKIRKSSLREMADEMRKNNGSY